MSKKKETIGKTVYDLLQKTDILDKTVTSVDIRDEALKDYEENVLLAVKDGKKKFDSDFYVIVLLKRERVMNPVIRKYYFARESCPTPDYDQAVYRYNKELDSLDFLWVVPSKPACEQIYEETLLNPLNILPEEKELVNFVLSFYEGDLLAQSKRLNEEISPRILK